MTTKLTEPQNESASAGTPPAPQKRRKSPLLRVIETVASLRLTVILFSLSLILVYYGTWAQVDLSTWTTVKEYFRSAIVWIPLKTVLMRTVDVNGSIPFPGGWLLGALLMTNLLAAHAVRFRMTWARSGILLIHGGLIILMLSEVVAGLYQIEGQMSIFEGSTSNFVEDSHTCELAVVSRADPKVDIEIIIPQGLLKPGAKIADADLPFDIEVVEYMKNGGLSAPRPGNKNPATAGTGLTFVAAEKGETVGVSTSQEIETPAAYVRIKQKGTGQELGTYLVSSYLAYMDRPAEEVVVDGQKYYLSLRFQRMYRPYSIQLLEFRWDKFQNTEIARNYSSKIRLRDPEMNEDREVLISMNSPLRYRGETFYQQAVLGSAKGTILQVVRNPGMLIPFTSTTVTLGLMPYIACTMISGGMLIHFGIMLIRFLERRLAS